jgi:hypothetical protein
MLLLCVLVCFFVLWRGFVAGYPQLHNGGMPEAQREIFAIENWSS